MQVSILNAIVSTWCTWFWEGYHFRNTRHALQRNNSHEFTDRVGYDMSLPLLGSAKVGPEYEYLVLATNFGACNVCLEIVRHAQRNSRAVSLAARSHASHTASSTER